MAIVRTLIYIFEIPKNIFYVKSTFSSFWTFFNVIDYIEFCYETQFINNGVKIWTAQYVKLK
mgnify:CR=1 FL=1